MPLPVPGPRPAEPNKSQAQEQALPGLPTAPPPRQASQSLPPRNAGAPPRRQAATSQPAARRANPLDAIDFSRYALSSIDLRKLGVDFRTLPILQQRVGKPDAKNYVRELRLVKDDGNSRGPIVVDTETGRLFRQLPKSEFAGDDPVLLIDDFDADDLNAEASNLLGHLQVTSSREEKAIALALRQQKQRRLAAAEEPADELEK